MCEGLPSPPLQFHILAFPQQDASAFRYFWAIEQVRQLTLNFPLAFGVPWGPGVNVFQSYHSK